MSPTPATESGSTNEAPARPASQLPPEERVLSTLNADGSRRWLRPRVSSGRFLTARRIVAYALMLVFTLVPYLRIGGRPVVLLDVPRREFTLFGTTFLPTDTLLLALLALSIFVTIFLVTALFGRIWCGWACPQTVYLEFLYRPIERLFEGRHYRTGAKADVHPLRRVAKYVVFLVLSMFLAHTFLAYFVGTDQLFRWVRQSPLEHPTAFIVMAFTTGLMMLDFGVLREQVCILMCPYGRLQSVMLDRQSMIISYDRTRGEPRGKKRRDAAGADVALPVLGDCIDCRMCVTTCPTGIDIRDGLQMECIGCAQCIDACDAVMDKIRRPRGLIRYSSQESMATGRRHLLRPRVLIYPTILVIVLALLGFTLAHRAPFDITMLRVQTTPYVVNPDGTVASSIIVKITNRDRDPHTYSITVDEDPNATSRDLPLVIVGADAASTTMLVTLPADRFVRGRADITVRVHDETGVELTRTHHVVGPLRFGASNPAPEDAP